MGAVNLAACKIATSSSASTAGRRCCYWPAEVVFAAHSGLWGVLVIDMIQFFIKMSRSSPRRISPCAAAGGGLHGLVDKLSHQKGPHGNQLPQHPSDFHSNWACVAVFIMPSPCSGGPLVPPAPNRAAAVHRPAHARQQKRTRLAGRRAVLHIATMSCACRDHHRPGLDHRLPELSDIRAAFPPSTALVNHDIAYRDVKFLPSGWIGLWSAA